MTPPLTRAEATHGVTERLETSLHAYGEVRLIEIPAQFLRPPPAEPGEAGGSRFTAFFGTDGGIGAGGTVRVVRGGRLPDLTGTADDVTDAIRDLWEHAGCRVDDTAGLDGRMLVVHDPAGYTITLTRHFDDDPILTVSSPPVAAPRIDRGLLAGLLAGLTLGCLGPCAGSVFGRLAIPALAGWSLTYWAWVPLLLLIGGGSLWRPETRRFGAGLLLSATVVGATVAGIVAV